MDARLQEIGGIRTFKDLSLQESIDRAVDAAAPGHGAVVAHGTIEGGQAGGSLSIVGKTASGKWTVVIGGYAQYHGDLGAGAKVIYQW